MKTIYTKLDEFLEEPNTNPVIKLVTKLYNLDANPYLIFKKNMEPYYLKALVNEQIRERQEKNYFTTPEIQQWIFNAMAQQQPPVIEIPIPDTRRQARELQQEQRQQAEEAVIQESRYPLRNRIQSRINQSDRQ